MFDSLKKLFGDRRPAKPARTTRLAFEELGDRVLPSASVPNLVGDTIRLDGPYSTARQLVIQSEHDNGDGTGTFVGVCRDTYGTASVSGTIAYTGTDSPIWLPLNHDFYAIRYGGFAACTLGGYEYISGSGTLTSVIDDLDGGPSSDPAFYGPSAPYLSLWSYAGSDTETCSPSFGTVVLNHTDSDYQLVIPNPNLSPLNAYSTQSSGTYFGW